MRDRRFSFAWLSLALLCSPTVAAAAEHPNERGFEHFYGHLHTEVGYFPPFSNQGGKDFQRNGVSIDDQGYETFLLADEASRYIRERDKSRPFFLYMPFIAPHTPLDAPDDLKAKYADLEDDRQPARSKNTDQTRQISRLMLNPSARPMYAAVVDAMDQAIGRVLTTLDEQGIADDTIVVFFSDNGGAAYAMGGADNVPLRGGKGETFEGGIRVVATMRWPGQIPASAKLESIMSVMDLFPTLTEASGVKALNTRKLDGRSQWSAITKGQPSPREDYLFFASETPIRGAFSLTAFNDEWKLVQEVRQGLLSADVSNFLFQIADDPNEHNNLAADHPDVVAEMAAAIHRWRSLYPVAGTRAELVPPPGWRAPRDWVGYPIPLAQLQDEPAPGMPPANALRPLDWMHGEAGRLIYDCEPWILKGGLCK
jgi:arylsulfatase B